MSQPDGNPVAHTGTPQSSSTGAAAAPPAPVSPTGEAPQTTRAQAPAPGGDVTPSTGNRNPEVDTQWGTALALLDRMERILNDATKEPGKIEIDRGAIDEMRAEIAQIRVMLRAAVRN
jgi:hypothetical protein